MIAKWHIELVKVWPDGQEKTERLVSFLTELEAYKYFFYEDSLHNISTSRLLGNWQSLQAYLRIVKE